jgi:hypothetical protein
VCERKKDALSVTDERVCVTREENKTAEKPSPSVGEKYRRRVVFDAWRGRRVACM